MSKNAYRLLEPFQLGPVTLRNRIALAPMGTFMVSPDGSVNKMLIDYYTRYARGGAGLIIPEGMHVDDKESCVLSNCLAIHHNRYVPGLNMLVESIQDEGAAVIAQLAHGGSQAIPENIHGLTPVAPSPISSKFKGGFFYGVEPRILDQEKIEEIQESFAKSALRAQNAGFNGVEIHGANGYLLTQFLSPRSNLRQDKYGGPIENRGRMALEIIDRIRATTRPGFIVGYRICGDERVEGGISLEDVISFVKLLESAGIDYIHVVSGIYETIFHVIPTIYVSRGSNLHLSEMIKKNVKVPVLCAGGLNVEVSEQALRDGKMDIAAMGRQLIADPELPLKLMEGRAEDIRPCIRGNVGCMRALLSRSMTCEVNPGIGKDNGMHPVRVSSPKKVLVIGGGVAGLETARLAAEKGHRVIIVEKTTRLGGHLLEGSVPEFKKDISPLLEWLKTQVGKGGIEVRLGTVATVDLVKKEKPDVLVVAVGSEYAIPADLADDAHRFVLPVDVLLRKAPLGMQVVVAGGGFVGCEIALHVAESLNKMVTIVEMTDDILADYPEVLTQMSIRIRLQQAGIQIRTGLTLRSYANDQVVCTDKSGEEHRMRADSVILATGLRPRDDFASEFEGLAPSVFRVGDCTKPGKIHDAFREAWRIVPRF